MSFRVTGNKYIVALKRSLQELGKASNFDSRKLIKEIEATMAEAEETILNVATPAVFNNAVNRFVGQLIAMPDGQVIKYADWKGPTVKRVMRPGPHPKLLAVADLTIGDENRRLPQ